jgi:hypothetical protein
MNHAEKQTVMLARRKGLQTTSISGIVRVVWHDNTTSPACTKTLELLEKMPDFDFHGGPPLPASAISLEGLNEEERNNRILQLMAGALH